MATSNRDRVGQALEHLGEGLRPYVEREMKAEYWERAAQVIVVTLAGPEGKRLPKHALDDVQNLLKLMWDQWNSVFRKKLSQAERTLVSELRDARNRWAHQEAFSVDDTYRTLDSAHRLLTAVSAEEATEVDHMKQEVLRISFEQATKKAEKQAALFPTEGTPAAGLLPWREIATPHKDVASGRYQQAEFAADLGQVFRGEGSDEYRDPKEFFRRTYLTEGLTSLLTLAVERLTGSGGEPVVGLQTNFGGGKTHSLLALHHAFSGVALAELSGLEAVIERVGVRELPDVRRAVLVGTSISPGRVHEKPDGTKIRTLWGEVAWQLGGPDGYAMVAQDDERATNPGDQLNELFREFGPCLILIDEWVAYARQLYGVDGLPAGSFDTHYSFAQALTEAAHAVEGTLVVVALPASDIEIGGVGGEEALKKLSNVVASKASPWRPALPEESFEIVRRRLFDEMTDPVAFSNRDATVRAFLDLYKGQDQEFPTDCHEADYGRLLASAFPIHPELFKRLYEDWGALEKFQRMRGVLRLMAAVIHALWEREDKSLMIMPGTIPIDDPAVQRELTRYLEDNWVPVIERDVDGASSTPLGLDRGTPGLGRYSAARRVARTIFLGSAATVGTAHRGLEDQHIKLGCVQPGEGPAVFGDALRRLTDQAFFLYGDGQRYWYQTQPTVQRLARDRASALDQDVVFEEIIRRLRADRGRGDFAGVHIAPTDGGDIPDETEVRLAVLGPDTPHAAKAEDSPARVKSAEILQQRGGGPRRFRNMLLFAAADKTRLSELEDAVRQYIAWRTIVDDHKDLNLDAFGLNQATAKRDQFDETVDQRMRETYMWVLVPTQPDPQGQLEWNEVRLQPQDALAVRASKKLRSQDELITQYAPTLLRHELDRIPLWEGDHAGLKKLWEDFAQYPYLPRLRDSSVMLEAVRNGVASTSWNPETFGYAEGYSEKDSRYLGLKAVEQTSVLMNPSSLLVKPEVTAKQLEEEGAGAGPQTLKPAEPPRPGKQVRRFHGVKRVDPVRLSGEAGTIANEVVQHLTKLSNAEVEVTIEIAAKTDEAIPDDVQRTVTENAKTLKFDQFGFVES